MKPVPRLVVGHYYTYTAHNDDRVWIALDTDSLAASIHPGAPHYKAFMERWEPTEYDWPHYKDRRGRPFSTNGYYSLRSFDPYLWSVVERLSFNFFANVVEFGQRLHPQSKEAYASGILEYMRDFLHHSIPNPAF